jgi:subtilisin family serine protease
LLVVATFALLMCPVARAADPPPAVRHEKVGPGLARLYDEYLRQGVTGAARHARRHHVRLDGDRVEVVLKLRRGHVVDEAEVVRHGATIKRWYRDLVLAWVPLSRLDALARDMQNLEQIRLPYRPRELVESQGVKITGARDYHDLGVDGTGVEVAIIDLGFQNLAATQAAGELPLDVVTVDYTGTGIQSTTKHGTGVAEVVHDMAPGAQLYLLKVDNEVDLGNAEEYCIANGIDIINHSVGWFLVAFYDGTGVIDDIANEAYAHGILWVNSAGNSANTHYYATLTDTDGDRRHEFAPGDEALDFLANGDTTVEIAVSWDAYPSTRDDYDLFLYDVDPDLDPGAAPVASSESTQGPFPAPPVEELIYAVPTTGTYYLVIRKKAASDADLPLHAFFFQASALEYKSTESSLAQPADAAGVLAVGAVNLSDALRGYSARGPTSDGRTKPDVTAPDGVVNSVYVPFAGTSAASPHVAGAAALVLAQDPALTVQQLWDRLVADTVDLGAAGNDDLYGAGRISLDADRDGVLHDLDNCPLTVNLDQADLDADGVGDVCDNCPADANADQGDSDGDGAGDACDRCPGADDSQDADLDTVPEGCDNCTRVPNSDQRDTDSDQSGNVCDCDFNQDSFCGGPDFTLFIGCFDAPTGGNATCEAADMNGDGFVGGPDFTLFIGGFNGPPGP